ncbi:MAG: TlpA family protein disulfide reductase [Isosphaeraceae bacterium]
MRAIRVSLILAVGIYMLSLEIAGPAGAQEATPAGAQASGRFATLDELDASYRRQRHELECRRIADLAALAGKVRGAESDAAYRQLFGLAITQGLCREAEAAATRCLATDSAGRDVRALAALVRVLARVDRGEHDQVLSDWKGLIQQSVRGPEADLDVDLTLAVGESLLQRLIRDGRYEVARKVCRLACEPGAPPLIRGHFEGRFARLDRLGKPAPAIVATDVDGKPVSLAELKGRVVLVEFWATWCPPCVAAIPGLEELERRYHDRGLVILGINVDAMHEDVKDAKAAMSTVRRFLVRHRVTWTNVLNGEGAADFARAYGVEEIPANFLVGKNGQILAVEQSGEALERAVAGAIGDKAAEPGQ